MPVKVVNATDGTPLKAIISGRWTEVRLLRRPWRIDQYWWTDRPINRVYYQVAPDDGPPFTVFRDLLTGDWFEQEY